MNILNNSIDALEEHKWTENEAATIKICTQLKNLDGITIHISDHGSGALAFQKRS
jgi:nitrogen fixation/metabolism regulation signal transduction histidine kinase